MTNEIWDSRSRSRGMRLSRPDPCDDLFAMHRNAFGRFHSDAHLGSLHAEHDHRNVIADDQCLSRSSRDYKHRASRVAAIIALSPQWEQEGLPLYVLLLIRGQRGETAQKRAPQGAHVGTRCCSSQIGYDSTRARPTPRAIAFIRRQD